MSQILIANKDYVPIINILKQCFSEKILTNLRLTNLRFWAYKFLTTIDNDNSNLKEDYGIFYTQQLKRDNYKLLAITCIPNTPEIIEAYKSVDDDTLLIKQFMLQHSHYFINNDLLQTPGLKGSRNFKSFIKNHLTEFKKKKKEYVHYLEEWELYKMFVIEDSELLNIHKFKAQQIALKNELIQKIVTESTEKVKALIREKQLATTMC